MITDHLTHIHYYLDTLGHANMHMVINHYGKHIKGKALEVDDTVKMYDLERIGDTFGGTIEKQS